MSSTERAPEPTMEEILASIRRIIADDDTSNAAPQNAESEEYAAGRADEAGVEDAADTQIIDDIARVLSGAGSSEAPTDEDILDLTDLGEAPAEAALGDVPGEAEFEADASMDEFLVVEDIVVETESVDEDHPAPSFAAAFPSSEPSVEAVEPDLATVSEAEPPQDVAAAPEPATEPVAPVVAETPKASGITTEVEDATTALERAIAALKAGDLAAFAREADSSQGLRTPIEAPAAPSMTPMPPLQAVTPPAAEPEAPAPVAELESASNFVEDELLALDEPMDLGAPEPEPEPAPQDEAAPEPEVSVWAETAPSWVPESETPPTPETVSSSWRSEERSWKATPASEFKKPARTNGGSGHKRHHEFEEPVSSSKSLEDSVKDMLRPLLRQWLDENMQRVLTAALREELEDKQTPRHGN